MRRAVVLCVFPLRWCLWALEKPPATSVSVAISPYQFIYLTPPPTANTSPVQGIQAEDAEADADASAGEAEGDDAGMGADEEDEDFSEYSNDDSSEEDAADGADEIASDVLTSSVFLGHTAASIPAGSEISALVGFHNVGNRPYIVKSVQGSIRDAADFSFVLQNFTLLDVGTSIDGGEQASIMYKFLPENSLDPRDVSFEIAVNYADEDDDAVFSSAAFNGTITITDSETGTPLLVYIKSLVAFACIIYGALQFVPGAEEVTTQIKSQAKSAMDQVETGTTKKAEVSWTDGMIQAGKSGKKKKAGK